MTWVKVIETDLEILGSPEGVNKQINLASNHIKALFWLKISTLEIYTAFIFAKISNCLKWVVGVPDLIPGQFMSIGLTLADHQYLN